MFGDPGPVEWMLGALLLVRLVEFLRLRGDDAHDGARDPTFALFHAAWLTGLVMFATTQAELSIAWSCAALALLGARALASLRGRRPVPLPATIAELLVLPLAFGLWPYALAGAALYAALAWHAGRRAS